ncbi:MULTISPECIES: hypothetical protein [Micromonospora]|uniref:hypothetical protein n=1 Tax=Micromonospora TaxID=1873 RepID=UPI0007DB5092|nr:MULTISPECIES: hypothetical protein [unclassified Micromonospora]MBQ1064570.1 hypothetical protein [Micromonospora sp. C41]MBQ1067000.1 hypothetical protein [Micromonospora sp. D75]WBB86054.1 hypothetical protein O7542_02600 [Micromonospora sp. WMMC264]
MSRRKVLLVAVGLLIALLPCALAWRSLWPVRIDALCGVFQSRQGGVVKIEPDRSFTVSAAVFGPNDTVSGSGQLRPGDLAADGHLILTMKDAKVSLELDTRRSWRGNVSLWHWADDPDTGERETFVQKSAC